MLDLYQDQINENLSQLKPTQDVEPGIWANFASGTRDTAMMGLSKAARAVSMALSVPAIAEDAYFGTTTATERHFKWHDEVMGRAVDYWTPKPNEVGVAGEVAGSLLSMLPLIFASPAAAVAATQLGTAEDLARKYPDVSATKANVVGAVQGAGLGLGIWMPILGQTLAQRVLVGGAGFNVLQGAVTRGVSGEILAGTKAEKDFEAFDGKALTLDLLLGLAFGMGAHVIPSQRAQGAEAWGKIRNWAMNMKPSEIDALMVLREAQHLNVDSLPGKPATGADVSAHVDRMRQAIDQTVTDQPIDVQNIRVQDNVSREPSNNILDNKDIISEKPSETGGVEQGLDTPTRQPLFTPDAAQVRAAEAQGNELQAAATRVRMEEGLPKPEQPITRPPADITGLDPVEQVKAVGRHIERALLQTGMQRDEAAANAAIWEAFAKSAHERYGVPPAELMAKWGVDVRRMDSADKLLGSLENRYDQSNDPKVIALQKQLAAIESKYEPLRKSKGNGDAQEWNQQWDAVSREAAAVRQQLFDLTGDAYGRSPRNGGSEFNQSARPLQTDTPEFKNWFGDSKVVDAEGKPLVVYHGTPDATFDVFKDEAFFSPEPEIAARYMHPSASSIASKAKAGEARAIYPVFLNIKQPFDTRIPAVRKIFDSEFLGKYGNGTPLGNKGLPDWTDARDIAEWINETGQPFDGMVVDEGGFQNDAGGVTDRGISYVPMRGDQVKSATGNRGTFDPNNPNILYQSQPWYSELTRQVDGIKMNAAPAKGWKDTIKGLSSKGVIKPAEIEATGLNEWLDLQEGKVTKQQVQDFIAQNGVRVEEVTLGDFSKTDMKIVADGRDAEYPYALMVNDVEQNRFRDSVSAESELESLRVDASHRRLYRGLGVDTKFSQYQLPGGENYRELLLTLPKNNAKLDAAYWDAIARKDVAGAQAISEQRLTPEFQSSHFDQTNILAHIRFNERTDADGKRVLFIEEIQSDWAQKGKKLGFKHEITDEEIQSLKDSGWEVERDVLDPSKPSADPSNQGFKANRSRSRFAAVAKSEREAWAQALRETREGTEQIPLAPFVTKTEAWVALSLKRMIRYAAENGFERVAWTNGDQQAARYDLSKQVDSLWYQDGRLQAYKNGDRLIDKPSTPEELPSIIGKEAAERLMAVEPNKSGIRKIDGEQLKVGGEGMKAFYDKIVPNVANDVLKKLGGGRATETTIGTKDYFDNHADAGTWAEHNLPKDHEYSIIKVKEGFAVFDEFDKKYVNSGVTKQPSFEITPELKAKALEGLPLFQGGTRGAVNFQTGKTLIGLFEKADKTTFQHETGHVFLEMTKDLASRADAPVAALQDWATIANWLKIEGGEITRDAHEQWARGWEKYLAEGVAPNEGLKNAFKRFRDWIIDVYKSLTNIDAVLNNQIRGVMARLLESQAKDPITPEEIAAQRAKDEKLTPAKSPTELAAPRAQGGGDFPPPLTAAERPEGAADNPLANEARRFATENPAIKVNVGTDESGQSVYRTLNEMLDDAAAETELAMRDVQLFAVAAECLMGVA